MSDKKSVTIIFVADGTWGNDDGASEFRDSEVKNFCFSYAQYVVHCFVKT